MCRHSRSVRGFALALAAVAGFAVSAMACPQNCLYFSPGYSLPGLDYCTSAAQMDTSWRPNYTSWGELGYSIPRGTLYSTNHSGFDGCQSRTTVEDDFSVIGMPAGTVVTLTARLALSLRGGSLEGGGHAYAELVEAASNSSAVDWGTRYFDGTTRDTALTLPVTAMVGTPFHMRFVVGCSVGALCSAQWHGSFDFTGLPAGVSVASCNGYGQLPTPTRPTSWGSLKARYR